MDKAREILRISYYPEPGMPEDLRLFGFHYADNVDAVINAASVLELYNKWPEDGSYFEQDAKLISDMLRWTQIKRHVEKTEFKKAGQDGR
jgi:hypothetical protein